MQVFCKFPDRKRTPHLIGLYQEKIIQFEKLESQLGDVRPVFIRCCNIFSISTGSIIIAIIFISDRHFEQHRGSKPQTFFINLAHADRCCFVPMGFFFSTDSVDVSSFKCFFLPALHYDPMFPTFPWFRKHTIHTYELVIYVFGGICAVTKAINSWASKTRKFSLIVIIIIWSLKQNSGTQ